MRVSYIGASTDAPIHFSSEILRCRNYVISMLQRVLLKVGGAHTRGFTPRGLYAQSEHARFCGLPNIATSMSLFNYFQKVSDQEELSR